ncbi:MAG: hypothetical protein HRT63_11545, partial [Erythrobacter sp.]|nr:hypothetical protein [Erythrobacter sp.]
MSEFIVNTIKGHTANAKVTIDDTCDVEEILNAKGGISVDGGATISDGLTIDSGGINVTGPAVLGGGVNNGLTVNNGGATISGGASINGNAVVTGSISSTTTITAGTGMTVSSGDLNVSGGNIVVSGTVDGVDLQALNNSVSSITTDYLDKTSTSDNNISGSILLDDDKVLALSASGTGVTKLGVFSANSVEIAHLQTN